MTDTEIPAENERLDARISGRVQGVNFRVFAFRKAAELGLTGWVRNRPDGSVATVAEGPKPYLESYVAFLWQGSPGARVDGVDVAWSAPTGEFQDFRVLYG